MPGEPKSGSALTRALPLLRMAALIVVVAGLRAASPVLLPLLLALFLAVLSLPLLNWFRRRGVRRSLALVCTVIADLAVLFGLGFLVSGAVTEFIAQVPGYNQRIVEQAKRAVEALAARGIQISDWLSPEQFDANSVLDVASNILGGTVRGVTSLVTFTTMTLLAMIFILAEAMDFRAKLGAAFGDNERIIGPIAGITDNIQRYLGVKTLVSAATGVFITLWVALLGVDFPVVWGMLAFFLNYIPAVGSIIAAVPAVILTVVQIGPGRAALVAIGYVVVNFALGNVVEPLLMGRRFGLSPLAVLFSLVFWGWVWGPIGMILSIPLTMVIKITLDHTQQLRWLAVLIGPSHRGKPVLPDPDVEPGPLA